MTHLKAAYFILFFITTNSFADSFNYNTYNNHGIIGLINMPTARFYEESVHGITLYDGTPDQKITLTSNPYGWLEASFFYNNIQNAPYCEDPGVEFCNQDLKDKGFNIKLRIKEQDNLPAVAIGLMDFAGTGYYSSEYIVTSYAINNIDMHYGLGWGNLDGSKDNIKNPLGYVNDSFKTRPFEYEDKGGQFQPSRYFSGESASPFYGVSYSFNSKTLLKIEKDTILTRGGRIEYPERESDYSFGIDYTFNDNFVIGLSHERNSYTSLKFIYKNNPRNSFKKYEYKTNAVEDSNEKNLNKYDKLISNLETNGIGVNKIIETSRSIGLELTQFVHPNLQVIEEIVLEASRDAGIQKDIKKNLKIVDLDVISEFDDKFEERSQVIYQREKSRNLSSSTGIKLRPFIASREEFFKGALLIENETEYVITDGFMFNINLKYSLADNFDDLRFPPVDTYPAQVRSDIKQYLKNMDNGILIGRAQFDYYLSASKNQHIMLTAGILEDMFSGYGMEYLYYKNKRNYSFGVELFHVKKRDYDWGFGHLEYENTTAHLNFHYRNYGLIPFDMKISYGEYLAGDVGTTIEFSRSYANGLQFGVFASNTDVTAEQFGEGTFDKGLFFNIPIYGNLINYSWRPLTKDPAAKLIRRNTLQSLLVKFQPIN